jgi:hypothetical protein
LIFFASLLLEFISFVSSIYVLARSDMMGRNLDRRVECYFPVLDEANRLWIERWVLTIQAIDNQKVSFEKRKIFFSFFFYSSQRRILGSDGKWVYAVPTADEPLINSQETCIASLVKKKEDFTVQQVTNQEELFPLLKICCCLF